MFAGSWGTTLESVAQSRGVSTAEALNIRSRTAYTPHLLRVKVMGDKDKDKDKDKENDPSSLSRTGVGRRPTPTSRTGHLSRVRPDLPTNCPEIIGEEST